MLQSPCTQVPVFFWGDARKGHFKEACILDCVKYCQITPKTGCTGLHSSQQCMKVPLSPKPLLVWYLNIYIVVYLVGGQWSPVGLISIRKPEYLLRGLAVREVPSATIWTVPEMPSGWTVSSTTAPSSPHKLRTRAGHTGCKTSPSSLTANLCWIPISLPIKTPAHMHKQRCL